MNSTKLPTLVSWLCDDCRPHLMFLCFFAAPKRKRVAVSHFLKQKYAVHLIVRWIAKADSVKAGGVAVPKII
jgi:hypothetical protein